MVVGCIFSTKRARKGVLCTVDLVCGPIIIVSTIITLAITLLIGKHRKPLLPPLNIFYNIISQARTRFHVNRKVAM